MVRPKGSKMNSMTIRKPSIDTLLREIVMGIGSGLYWRAMRKPGPLAAATSLIGLAMCDRICTGKSRWRLWPDSLGLAQRFPDARPFHPQLTYRHKEKESELCQ
jgi:hypothetical protein